MPLRHHPFDCDVRQRSGYKNTACIIQHIGYLRLVLQFINRRPLDHARYCNLPSYGRDENRVTVLDSFSIRTHTSQQKLVEINFMHQFLSTKVTSDAKRTYARRPSCCVQRIERCRQGTYVIGSWALHIAHNVDPYSPQSRDGYGYLCVSELLAQRILDQSLCSLERQTRQHNRSSFGQNDLSLTIHGTRKALRNTSPQIDDESITYTKNVVRSYRNIHRHLLRVQTPI